MTWPVGPLEEKKEKKQQAAELQGPQEPQNARITMLRNQQTNDKRPVMPKCLKAWWWIYIYIYTRVCSTPVVNSYMFVYKIVMQPICSIDLVHMTIFMCTRSIEQMGCINSPNLNRSKYRGLLLQTRGYVYIYIYIYMYSPSFLLGVVNLPRISCNAFVEQSLIFAFGTLLYFLSFLSLSPHSDCMRRPPGQLIDGSGVHMAYSSLVW